MFVYSLKASTLKFFAVVCVALTALVMMITFIPSYDGGEIKYITTGNESKINYSKIKTNEDRIAFLSQFGWRVEQTPVEEVEVTVPEKFDKVFNGYNEIQKRQGLDLSKYKGKTVTRYTYEVTNYENENGKVYANVIVYRNKVIGGDVCSAKVGGFIHGFSRYSVEIYKATALLKPREPLLYFMMYPSFLKIICFISPSATMHPSRPSFLNIYSFDFTALPMNSYFSPVTRLSKAFCEVVQSV